MRLNLEEVRSLWPNLDLLVCLSPSKAALRSPCIRYSWQMECVTGNKGLTGCHGGWSQRLCL
jgi:hypothetical protein